MSSNQFYRMFLRSKLNHRVRKQLESSKRIAKGVSIAIKKPDCWESSAGVDLSTATLTDSLKTINANSTTKKKEKKN